MITKTNKINKQIITRHIFNRLCCNYKQLDEIEPIKKWYRHCNDCIFTGTLATDTVASAKFMAI